LKQQKKRVGGKKEMNKAELLAYISSKPQVLALGPEELKETANGYNRYIVNATVSTGPGAMTMQNIGFYEKVSSGDCLFMNREPFPTAPETFESKVNNKILAAINAGRIKAAFPVMTHRNHKKMILSVIKSDDSKAEFLAFEKTNGSIDYIEII